jgi:lipoprotein signal peptidase
MVHEISGSLVKIWRGRWVYKICVFGEQKVNVCSEFVTFNVWSSSGFWWSLNSALNSTWSVLCVTPIVCHFLLLLVYTCDRKWQLIVFRWNNDPVSKDSGCVDLLIIRLSRRTSLCVVTSLYNMMKMLHVHWSVVWLFIYLFICLFIYLLIYVLWVLPSDPHFLMLHFSYTFLLLEGLGHEGMREVNGKYI